MKYQWHQIKEKVGFDMQAKTALKNIVRTGVIDLFSTVAGNVKMKENHVLLIESSYPSGSNTKILENRLKEAYTVEVIQEKDIYKPMKSAGDLWKRIKTLLYISKFPVLVTTHGFNKVNKNQKLINLWHGIPLKSMGRMEEQVETLPPKEFNMDYLVMTSKMQSVLMSACIHTDYNHTRILGNPRNDYFNDKQSAYMASLTGSRIFNKVLLYMPTFRQGFANRTEGIAAADIFNFGDVEKEKAFVRYVEKNDYLLIIKLHPLEEKILAEKFKELNSPNILVLNNEKLRKAELDIYQLLPEVDLLITDYSSIYFDFLLLDKPMVFVNNDLESYKGARGLLLEPYEYWTPGYKSQDYSGLEAAIEDSFSTDAYSSKRSEMKDVFHLYQDGKSSERVLELIRQQFT